MQWKLIGWILLILQIFWSWRGYSGTSILATISLLAGSLIFFFNSARFLRNFEICKREFEQLFDLRLEDSNVTSSKGSGVGEVVDDAMAAMRLQLDAAKRERDQLHRHLIEAREEVRKGDSFHKEATLHELTSGQNEMALVQPTSSTTACRYNARNKQLVKQLQMVEQQVRQQAQALADADLRVQRASEAERMLDQVLKHVTHLEKERRASQRRIEQLQKMTGTLSKKLSDLGIEYERSTREAIKVQEILIKRRDLAINLMKEAQRETLETKREAELARASFIPPEMKDLALQTSSDYKKNFAVKRRSSGGDGGRNEVHQQKSPNSPNRSAPIPSEERDYYTPVKMMENRDEEGAGDPPLLATKFTLSTASTGPELCPVDASSMNSLVSGFGNTPELKDPDMDFLWAAARIPDCDESHQRLLQASPQFSSLLARLEAEIDP